MRKRLCINCKRERPKKNTFWCDYCEANLSNTEKELNKKPKKYTTRNYSRIEIQMNGMFYSIPLPKNDNYNEVSLIQIEQAIRKAIKDIKFTCRGA
jgi:hypothetical protein